MSSSARSREQRAIAHILGTLDDKIELNRRMNETLEAMARALFKSWFVDFDPVRAKAEGRDPGLPKPLADLFPDSFEDSELGEIPKGWEDRERRRPLRRYLQRGKPSTQVRPSRCEYSLLSSGETRDLHLIRATNRSCIGALAMRALRCASAATVIASSLRQGNTLAAKASLLTIGELR